MAKRNNNDEDQPQDLDNLNDADNFGLPDIEYKPLEETKKESSEQVSETTSSSEHNESLDQNDASSSYSSQHYNNENDEKSNAPLIIGLIIGLVVVLSGFLIYYYVYKPQAEKAKQEQLAKEESERKRKEKEAKRIHYLEEKYETLPFLFEEITSPSFVMEKNLNLAQYSGFLDSWSATQRYKEQTGHHPLGVIWDELSAACGNENEIRLVRWPLYFRIGRNSPSL